MSSERKASFSLNNYNYFQRFVSSCDIAPIFPIVFLENVICKTALGLLHSQQQRKPGHPFGRLRFRSNVTFQGYKQFFCLLVEIQHFVRWFCSFVQAVKQEKMDVEYCSQQKCIIQGISLFSHVL